MLLPLVGNNFLVIFASKSVVHLQRYNFSITKTKIIRIKFKEV